MFVTSAAKLALASVYGYGFGLKAPASTVHKALEQDGIFVAPEPLTLVTTDRLLTVCDDVYKSHPAAVSLESNGSDARIFGVDRWSDDPVFAEVGEAFLAHARIFYGSDDLRYFCMAGDIRFQADGLGSGSGWHRDSAFRHQFKVIIYLSDASLEHGPFEFATGTHKASKIMEVSRFLGKPLAEDRFSDAEIAALVEGGVIDLPTAMIGGPGSVIYVDTRALHRGRPLTAGRRRALTYYIYHKNFPAPVERLLPPNRAG